MGRWLVASCLRVDAFKDISSGNMPSTYTISARISSSAFRQLSAERGPPNSQQANGYSEAAGASAAAGMDVVVMIT